jgi:pimeloyl-ACP methyl ester carboxylesterase
MKKNKTLKIVIITLSILFVCVTALYFVSVSIYTGSFNYRCTTSEEIAFDISEFPSITRERHTFKSNKKQTLVGYLYENVDESIDEKGVVVFAHGLGGGGQIGYLDIFNIMVENGYYVFAYDATGNDESEGDVIGGLPQGFIDLDYAITYAESIDEIKDLPFVLMGYSWGGLSVTNVLNYHPEVKAVASLAGWNKSMDLIDYRGCQMVGGVAKLLLPFASIYEFFEYGKYAFSTSMKGFENSDCGVLIAHSEDDTTIPIEYGYDLYYEKYKDDERFEFIRYKDRDHSILRDGNELDEELIKRIAVFFDKYTSL